MCLGLEEENDPGFVLISEEAAQCYEVSVKGGVTMPYLLLRASLRHVCSSLPFSVFGTLQFLLRICIVT